MKYHRYCKISRSYFYHHSHHNMAVWEFQVSLSNTIDYENGVYSTIKVTYKWLGCLPVWWLWSCFLWSDIALHMAESMNLSITILGSYQQMPQATPASIVLFTLVENITPYYEILWRLISVRTNIICDMTKTKTVLWPDYKLLWSSLS